MDQKISIEVLDDQLFIMNQGGLQWQHAPKPQLIEKD